MVGNKLSVKHYNLQRFRVCTGPGRADQPRASPDAVVSICNVLEFDFDTTLIINGVEWMLQLLYLFQLPRVSVGR